MNAKNCRQAKVLIEKEHFNKCAARLLQLCRQNAEILVSLITEHAEAIDTRQVGVTAWTVGSLGLRLKRPVGL